MIVRSVALCVTLLAGMAAAPVAHADEPATAGFSPAQVRTIMAAVDADRKLSSLLGQCPADLFGRRPPRPQALGRTDSFSVARCRVDAKSCLNACTKDHDGEACFGLARAFQDRDDAREARYAETLYAMACATGKAAGCTNRAAGIRNGDQVGDPFHGRFAAAERCQYRSFKIACDRHDAWGCTMLGQSHRYGEGTPVDLREARQAYELSCKIAPNFEACAFARNGLAGIGNAGR
jgi:hypothetical protein